MDQPDGCPEVPFHSFFGISDVLNLRESCMRENRTCSLRGGRRLACKRASSDPTGQKRASSPRSRLLDRLVLSWFNFQVKPVYQNFRGSTSKCASHLLWHPHHAFIRLTFFPPLTSRSDEKCAGSTQALDICI